MKIQCNVCEAAEAKVLCCADEAALCWECDEKVHAANKLASKHQRVPLSLSASHMPKCDICQEMVGYFFCLEDRALLCRNCDVSIHTANACVSGHQRFLLTGVRVGLEATEHGASSSSVKSQSGEKMSDAKSSVSYGGGYAAGNVSQWPIEELLGLNEFSQYYNYMDGSSKADSGKHGDSDSSVLRSSEEEMDDDGFLGRVPDSSWTVPQIPSPPTASGLYWPKDPRYTSDNTMFVPDICFSRMQQPYRAQNNSVLLKRRRQL
ncbi:B-box zinc finger protein 22 [Spatholobus suberectus]|nr:B-box zinc finger protein 22 [Spatholobus suberectus]